MVALVVEYYLGAIMLVAGGALVAWSVVMFWQLRHDLIRTAGSASSSSSASGARDRRPFRWSHLFGDLR